MYKHVNAVRSINICYTALPILLVIIDKNNAIILLIFNCYRFLSSVLNVFGIFCHIYYFILLVLDTLNYTINQFSNFILCVPRNSLN
jgi:hypothetical protein